MKRIAIDMDEVIADFNSKIIPSFNRRFDMQISLADLEGLTIQQLRPELSQQVEDMISETGFFADLDVIRHSQRVIKKTDRHP